MSSSIAAPPWGLPRGIERTISSIQKAMCFAFCFRPYAFGRQSRVVTVVTGNPSAVRTGHPHLSRGARHAPCRAAPGASRGRSARGLFARGLLNVPVVHAEEAREVLTSDGLSAKLFTCGCGAQLRELGEPVALTRAPTAPLAIERERVATLAASSMARQRQKTRRAGAVAATII
eukprot:CAMPEP_0180046842 /NCGR_PEP_ID=MMETSP0984-20121128/37440_2 /TAXON_ID=483367 /ORGANISM="non described non described, Strain CCMP 2436" /LENGTH=174 /DNA_ID=CAMNT_0021975639 /DNA_START=316 /DNA_END=838 /DNA_ORIENTATION=-